MTAFFGGYLEQRSVLISGLPSFLSFFCQSFTSRCNTLKVQSSYIRDAGTFAPRQLSVLTSHTMGVAALGPGQLEYMMLRFLNSTDDQGPWPLNDQGPLQVRPPFIYDFLCFRGVSCWRTSLFFSLFVCALFRTGNFILF
jgi:hypothetical protein